MASQPETPTYDASVYQYEVTDPVQGARGGVANAPILALADRTAWLKQQLSLLANGQLLPPNVAPLNGPAFTGSCTAPNVAPGDDSTLIANTDFVQTANSGIVTIATTGGTTVLSQPQWGVGILLVTGALTSAVSLVFPTRHGRWIVGNNTSGAFAVSCATVGGTRSVVIPQSGSLGIYCDGTNIFQQNVILTRNGEVTTADLAASGAAAGTYRNPLIAIDTSGRVTSAIATTPTIVLCSQGTTTINLTAGISYRYRLWGGGGGSGGTLNSGSIGGSGGGGGYVEGMAVSTGSVVVNVGFGGPGGNGTPSTGANGGGTTINGTAILAGGGGAGAGQAGAGAGASGAGGVATGGTFNQPGTAGALGWSLSGASFGALGGGSFGSGMGPPLIASSTVPALGATGHFPGQGGGGAVNGAIGTRGESGLGIIEFVG